MNDYPLLETVKQLNWLEINWNLITMYLIPSKEHLRLLAGIPKDDNNFISMSYADAFEYSRELLEMQFNIVHIAPFGYVIQLNIAGADDELEVVLYRPQDNYIIVRDIN